MLTRRRWPLALLAVAALAVSAGACGQSTTDKQQQRFNRAVRQGRRDVNQQADALRLVHLDRDSLTLARFCLAEIDGHKLPSSKQHGALKAFDDLLAEAQGNPNAKARGVILRTAKGLQGCEPKLGRQLRQALPG